MTCQCTVRIPEERRIATRIATRMIIILRDILFLPSRTSLSLLSNYLYLSSPSLSLSLSHTHMSVILRWSKWINLHVTFLECVVTFAFCCQVAHKTFNKDVFSRLCRVMEKALLNKSLWFYGWIAEAHKMRRCTKTQRNCRQLPWDRGLEMIDVEVVM